MTKITKFLSSVVLLFAVVAIGQTNYYNKASGASALQTLSNWGTNPDGTGSAPSSFTGNNRIYNIVNGTTASISSNWTVSGTNSKVVLGSASKPAITFNANNSFSGTIDITAATSGSNTLSIESGTIPNFGTLDAGSTVIYSRSGTQTVSSETYGNLVFDGPSGVKTFGGSVTVLGTLSITGGNTAKLNSSTTPKTHNIQNLFISAGTLDGGSSNSNSGTYTSILNISGNLNMTGGTITNTSSSDFSAIRFNGGTNQSYTMSGGTIEYVEWTVTGNSSLTLNSALPFSELTVDAGSTLDANTRICSADVTGTSVTVNGTLRTSDTAGLSGSASTTISSANSPSIALDAASTIEYYATSAQSVTSRNDYGNVIISGNSTKTAGGAVALAGTLTINAGSTFAAGSFAHSLGGNFVNDGTFSGGTSTVTLNGAGAQSIGGVSTTTFSNLTINKSSGLASLAQNANVSGTLTLSGGNFNLSNSNLLLGSAAVSGTFSATRMIYASGTGELRRTYSSFGSYTFPIGDVTGTAEYSPITINATAGGSAGAYIGVSVTDAKHPSNNSASNYLTRYWNVTTSATAPVTATVTATYVSADITGTIGNVTAGKLSGAFNLATNPWIRYTALSGTTLTATGATIPNGQATAFSGVGNTDVTVSGGGTYCQGSNVTLTANATGGGGYTYLWSNGLGTANTANPPTSAPGTTTYSVTVTDNNGLTATNTADVTINPVLPASVSITADQSTICAGTTVTFTATPVNGGTASYQWKRNGNNVGTNSATYSSSALANNDQVWVVMTSATPCLSGLPATSNTITMAVQQAATVDAGANQTVCSSAPAALLAGTFGGSATSVTWSGGSGTFVPNANTANATYTPSSAEITAGSVTLTLTTDDPAGLCGPVSDTMTITINTQASVTTSGNQTLCSSAGPASISGTRAGTGVTSSTWSTSGSGTFGNASSLATTYTPSNADVTAGFVTLTLTTNNPAGPCDAASSSLILTIDPAATVNAGGDQSVCANGSIVLSGSIGGGASSATWSAPSGSFSSTSDMNATYTPSVASGSVILTLTTNDPAGPCGAVSSAMTVTVLPVPTASNVVICQGGSQSIVSSTACPEAAPQQTSNLPASGATSGGGTAWSNPGNILTDNNSVASVSVSAGFSNTSVTSQSLQAKGFGFAIPANAVVQGISVNINRYRSGSALAGEASDNSVRLLKAGTAIGSNKLDAGNWGTDANSIVTYGSSSDLWGTAWTAADVNDSNFGLALVADVNAFFGTRTANVDYVQISVTYTLPGDVVWYTASSGGTPIASGGSFDPVGASGSGIADNNSVGVYTFYSACSANPGCRSAVTYTILQNVTYYADTDNDGYGNPAVSQVSCTGAPSGYVLDNTDCNDSDDTLHQSFDFYVDADNDGYGTGSAVSVCAALSSAAPAGYSVFDTDCDDTRATVHPGAVEIGYNLIDDDCDGLIDEGFPPKQTVLGSSQCNTTLAAIDTPLTAGIVAGAQGYRWRITAMSGSSAGEVQEIDTPLRTLRLIQLAHYAFNTTYKVEVAVYYAGYLQPYQPSGCTVTTPAVATQLGNCNQQLTNMGDGVYAYIIPYATGYKFRITDPLVPTNTQEIERPIRDVRLTMVNAFAVQYGKSYNIEVAVRNTDGSYLPYGPVCTVITPVFPTVGLGESQCDNYAVASAGEMIFAESFPGAVKYVFRLSGPGISGYQEITRNLRNFNLNMFSGWIATNTYNVSVRLIFNDADPAGPFGKVCTIVAPGLARMAAVDKAAAFDAIAYPNPFAGSFSVKVTTASSQDITVKVYDMTGRLIGQENAGGQQEISLGTNYPSGVYNVVVSQGDQVKTLRVLKR